MTQRERESKKVSAKPKCFLEEEIDVELTIKASPLLITSNWKAWQEQ